MALHALLVGIDAYRSPVPPLSGCVNDVRRMAEFLTHRAGGGAPSIKTLLDGEATRVGVIAAFREHLGAAGAGDTALFYFSGHGSQESAPPEFLPIEPDGLDETLVCVDSREPDRHDLADKELGALISEVAAGGAHVVVILDSCHSGTATRAPGETVRRAPTDERPRPIESFDLGDVAPGVRHAGKSSWVTSPAPHVLLAACRDQEEAKEIPLGGERRGVFSYFLLETLQQATRTPTYRELNAQVTALVRARVSQQWPDFESIRPQDLEQPFLGGAVADRPAHVMVSRDPQHGWVIDAGLVHGIPRPEGAETTTLAVFDVLPALGAADGGDALGTATVTTVLPHLSRVELAFDAGEPDPSRAYPAVVVGLPLPPLPVRFDGDPVIGERVREVLAPSLYVAEADPATEPELRVEATAERIAILRAADGRPVVEPLATGVATSAAETVQRLEQIARWTRLADLRNPLSRLPANAVEMTLYGYDFETGQQTPLVPEHGEFTVGYSAGGSEPYIKIRLRNTTDRTLWCALLDLPETYAVFTELLPGNRVELAPGAEVWVRSNEPIPVTIPPELAERGYVELKDLLKLLVSTEPLDVTALAESDLDLPVKDVSTRSVTAIDSTLDRLMRRVAVRHIGAAPRSERVADWVTTEVGLTVRRPADRVAVPGAGEQVQLAPGVTLNGHPALVGATARLDTPVESSRNLDSPPAPAILLDDPELSRPFELQTTRGVRPGPSVLVLEGELDTEAVAGSDPVVLRVATELGEDEHVLPVAWDGEQWVPLGFARRDGAETEVVLERLPEPVFGTRSLLKSVSVLLQKLVKPKLGLTYDYPQLAVAEDAGDGTVRYVKELAEVQQRVAAAQRIVLFVHGILGDTRGMAASAFRPPLAGAHDLVLTFDYENLNTDLESTARALKERLQGAGLHAGDGKRVHIVAHSMGGLVSRWLLEYAGGGELVDGLITLGTPNGGSPWPAVQKWATIAVGLGVNALAVAAWPLTALNGVLGLVEKIDVTLDQMEPGSTLLAGLAASPVPTVGYTLIAGDTSIPQGELGDDGRVTRLLAKLGQRAAGLAFFGQPNDIAVTVTSAGATPPAWAPSPTRHEVACDHLTYFTTTEAMEHVAAALT